MTHSRVAAAPGVWHPRPPACPAPLFPTSNLNPLSCPLLAHALPFLPTQRNVPSPPWCVPTPLLPPLSLSGEVAPPACTGGAPPHPLCGSLLEPSNFLPAAGWRAGRCSWQPAARPLRAPQLRRPPPILCLNAKVFFSVASTLPWRSVQTTVPRTPPQFVMHRRNNRRKGGYKHEGRGLLRAENSCLGWFRCLMQAGASAHRSAPKPALNLASQAAAVAQWLQDGRVLPPSLKTDLVGLQPKLLQICNHLVLHAGWAAHQGRHPAKTAAASAETFATCQPAQRFVQVAACDAAPAAAPLHLLALPLGRRHM